MKICRKFIKTQFRFQTCKMFFFDLRVFPLVQGARACELCERKLSIGLKILCISLRH